MGSRLSSDLIKLELRAVVFIALYWEGLISTTCMYNLCSTGSDFLAMFCVISLLVYRCCFPLLVSVFRLILLSQNPSVYYLLCCQA